MPVKGELVDAITNNDSSLALTLTCAHLHDKTTTTLEDDWIATSAYIGKTFGLTFGTLWNAINRDIVQLLEADEVNVATALLCTTKLILLCKRCRQAAVMSLQLHVATLRSKVIKFFPENATLSSAGFKRYARVLPFSGESNDDDMRATPNHHQHQHQHHHQQHVGQRIIPPGAIRYHSTNTSSSRKSYEEESESDAANPAQSLDAFCQRLLSGLSKLMIEVRLDDIRNSLEYLSKKRLRIPLMQRWPAPNEEEREKGDICWFLWGALCCYYGEAKVATNLKLFTWNWRKSARNERLGLLLGMPYTFDTNVLADWSYQEANIIERIEQSAYDLWMQYKDMHSTEDCDDQDDTTPSAASRMDEVFSSYVPRKVPTNNSHAQYAQHTQYAQQVGYASPSAPKMLSLATHKDKRRSKYAGDSKHGLRIVRSASEYSD